MAAKGECNRSRALYLERDSLVTNSMVREKEEEKIFYLQCLVGQILSTPKFCRGGNNSLERKGFFPIVMDHARKVKKSLVFGKI